MRLWHSKLIPLLDGKRLCDLHMSCCNLRGKGWSKPNKSVDYIYDDPFAEDALATYHHMVLKEMLSRGYQPDERWLTYEYCGKHRPARSVDPNSIDAVDTRDVPLLGHSPQLYLNDVKALQNRGLDIELSVNRLIIEGIPASLYVANLEGVQTYYSFIYEGE